MKREIKPATQYVVRLSLFFSIPPINDGVSILITPFPF